MRSLAPCLVLAACTPDLQEPPCGPEHAWETPASSYDGLDDALAERFASSGAHGMAIAVLVDGQITYAAAFGERDPVAGLPMTVHTRSRNGSTLKMQTAAVLLQLQEEGALSVDDTLDTLLPGLDLERSPGHLPATSVHHLLSHQGGLVDWTPLAPIRADQTARDVAYGVFARQIYAMSPPGEFYNYSNPNFALAGLVAEEVTAQPFASRIAETLWQPLCMDRTTLDPADVAADDLWASTSYPDGAETVWTTPESFVMPFSAPAGLAWTTVLDLLHFADLLLEGGSDVLPASAVDALTAPQVSMEEDGDRVAYGYGLMLTDAWQLGSRWYTTPLWTHGGGLPGYVTELHLLPEHGAAVAVMFTGGNTGYGDLALAHLLDDAGAPHGAPPEPVLDPAVLASAVGRYDDPFNVGTLFVTEVDGVLHIDAPLLDELELDYAPTLGFLAARTFLWNVTGIDLAVSFLERDTPGESRWLRTRSFVAERAEDDGPRARPDRPPAPFVRSPFPLRGP